MDYKNKCFHICSINNHTSYLQNMKDVNDIFIDKDGMKRILKVLEPTVACDPQGITAIMLKYCKASLSYPVTYLQRKSFNEGRYPKRLKGSFIHPYQKDGGSKKDTSGWKLLSCIPKLSLVFEHFNKYIIMNRLLQDIENSSNNGIIILGFAKVLDKIEFGQF